MKKAFTFDSTYVVHVELTATDHGSPVTALVAWPGGFGDQETLPDYAASQFDTMQNGKDDREAAKKVVGRRHAAWGLRLGGRKRPVLRSDFSS